MSEIEQQSDESTGKRSLKPSLFRILVCIMMLLPLECGARLFWVARGTPFLSAQRHIYRSFYPNVAAVERHPPASDDEDCFDILMLGGSVLHKDYGDIAHVLRERLIRKTGQCVRIHNVAAPAHTSLDSLYKYRHLAEYPFDLVLVYHGINEVRANNCPTSEFRDDYGHLSWYRLVNEFEREADSRWFALPYTCKFVLGKIADRLGWSGTLPTHRPSEESLSFGCEVKTAASVRENLMEIVAIAKARNHPLLLMSFAFHSPDDYSEELFEQRHLDYTVHAFATELWGRPDCVVKALKAHNEVVEEVCRAKPDTVYVDQAALIPEESLYFNDICHFTHEGSERFVENILRVALPLIERSR